MPIKSFRGKLEDGEIRRIHLTTSNGMTGYRIVKFTVMPTTDTTYESTLLIKKIKPTTADSTIDFDDPLLIAAAYYSQSSSSNDYPEDISVIFDNEVVNQDLWLSLKGHSYTNPLNYYIELEQFELTENAQSVATLRDIRTNTL